MIKSIKFYKRGFTLLEMLVVIAVIGIMVAVVFSSFSKMKENQVLKNAGEDIISTVNKARTQTLAQLNGLQYGVHFQANGVIIFRGAIFNSSDSNNQITSITSPAVISTITLTGGAVNLYFNKLSGTPNVSGSVIVSSTATPSLTKTITISATGAVSMN